MTALTSEEIREMLKRLDGEPADALESEYLEFKSGNAQGSEVRRQSRAIRESAVAFANAHGGNLVLGVADGKRTRSDAIVGVHRIEISDIQRDIYDGTDPHITVDVEEVIEPEGRVLIVRVPSSNQLVTTTDGIARIRVGKESKPLTGSSLAPMLASRGVADATSEIVAGEDTDAIDPAEINRLRGIIREEEVGFELNGLGDKELLEALGLVEGRRITMAAVLLLGRKSAIIRSIPQHELIVARFQEPTKYDFRRDLREPMLKTLDEVRRIVDANVRLTTIEVLGFHHFEIPDLSWLVIREAVLNALVHRDYFLGDSVHLNLYHDRVELSNPGGFVGDVSPQNVLRHRPVRRNHLLADALQKIGLVNRMGLGVDRIFEETLRGGKGLPRYEADIATVKLTLPTVVHQGFARFVAEQGLSGERLELEDLMIMRSLMTRVELNRWSAAELLQVDETDAAERLAALNALGLLEVRGRGQGSAYSLGRQFASWGRIEPDESAGIIDARRARVLVLQTITERGSITNSVVREITGYGRNQTVALMREMRDEGLVELRGRARGAHYVIAE